MPVLPARIGRRRRSATTATLEGCGDGELAMADMLYVLRGRLDDGISWQQIGLACVELEACKRDAQRFTEYYGVVEVINKTTGAMVFKASRQR